MDRPHDDRVLPLPFVHPELNPLPDFLTTSEIAKAFGLAASTIRHYRAEGKITPSTQTPGGHARWDLEKVREELSQPAQGVKAPAAGTITGLVEKSFPALGEHDISSSAVVTRPAPMEIIALGVREVDDEGPSEFTATHRRWGGEIVLPRRKAHA